MKELKHELEGKQMEKTYGQKVVGQKVVGISFNPSNDNAVDRLKQICANAIDEINSFRQETESHKAKNYSEIAIEHLMTAQMWAVKAITWKD